MEITYGEEFGIYSIFLCNSTAVNLGFGDSFVGVTYLFYRIFLEIPFDLLNWLFQMIMYYPEIA